MAQVLRKRKNYFVCSDSQQILQKKLIASKTEQLSDLSLTVGLQLNEIILSPENEHAIKPKITVLPFEISENKRISQWLIAKDQAQLSEKQYLNLRNTLLGFQQMPGLNSIRKLQHKLNEFFEIKNNDFGYYCIPEPKIKFVCENLLLNNPDFTNNGFKIKLNIDSTSITSSNIILLNISFNLIDDVEMAMNVNGTYLLGSFEIVKEDYEQIKEALKELLFLLENVKSFEIAQNTYKIDFYLGCDYKMIRILYGQKASNALDGCFWCPALMNEIPNADDVGTLKHTLSRRLNDPIENKEPIIKFIELNMCILDDLHMLLRVTDKLYDLFLLKCILIDKNDGEDLGLRKNLAVFLDFLEVKCKIKNAYYITSKRPQFGKIQFRSFNGNERMRIFTELYKPKKKQHQDALFMDNLPFPKIQNKDNFKREDLVWMGFYNLYNKFKNFPRKITIEERKVLIEPLNESLKEWLKDYMYINMKYNYSDKLSPYLHCFIFHYCQMLELHGNIHIFTTQPNEKLNDFCTQYYHRNTNKQNFEKKYLLQLVQKRNRMEFYNLEGDLEEFYLSENEDDNNDQIYQENF